MPLPEIFNRWTCLDKREPSVTARHFKKRRNLVKLLGVEFLLVVENLQGSSAPQVQSPLQVYGNRTTGRAALWAALQDRWLRAALSVGHYCARRDQQAGTGVLVQQGHALSGAPRDPFAAAPLLEPT